MADTGAIRTARCKALRDAGRRIARVEIDEVWTAEKLCAGGFLARCDVDNDRKVDAALARVVALWVGAEAVG